MGTPAAGKASKPGAIAFTFAFDPAFDEAAYPGPLGPGAWYQGGAASRSATAGEAWVGVKGLLAFLEERLGLERPRPSAGCRAAALIPALQKTEGFWSASAQRDPLGTARRILRWRDELWMAGWAGTPVSPRLGRLAQVTAEVEAGLPDRILDVMKGLGQRAPDLHTVRLFCPLDSQARLLRDLCALLERKGVRFEVAPPDTPEARGDLAAAQQACFPQSHQSGDDRTSWHPMGDGSIQLVRPYGPLLAAEEIAAWLAAQERLEGSVVIGAQPVLDAALRRHGLPTTGAAESSGEQALLQLLPLVLACGWDPPDPGRVLELLSLPVAPVRPALGRALAEALLEWPAVGSDEWEAAFQNGLDRIEDEEEREKARARAEAVLKPEVARGRPYTTGEVRTRLDVLRTWLRARWAVEEASPEPWAEALAQCGEFDALLSASGLEELNDAQLQKFLAQSTVSGGGTPPHPACAGLAAVSAPGCVAGPVRRVVWWDFVASTVPAVHRLPLTLQEQVALAAEGVELPHPGVQAAVRAERWGRPLRCVAESLLLVCPLTGTDGEPDYPHPLWDEIVARVDDTAGQGVLQGPRPVGGTAPKRVNRPVRAVPCRQRVWSTQVSDPRLRDTESPTSLAGLLGCPFQWVVRYLGKVRSGRSRALPEGDQLVGSTVHEILARVLGDGLPSPEEAESKALEIFDQLGPRLAAPLFLPGADEDRSRARHLTGASAGVLVRHLRQARLSVQTVETSCAAPAFGGTLRGRPDLVVGPPTTVVDLKLGWASGRRKSLELGTAYQLAAYGYLVALGKTGALPPYAFFILQGQRLLAGPGCSFRGVKPVEGPSPEETWSGFATAVRARQEELGRGQFLAAGVPDDEGQGVLEEDGLVEGRLLVTPPCRWCDCGVLCGKAIEEEV